MAARRGKTQARRNTGNGTPGWVWLIAGAAIAAVVFLGAPGLFKKDGDFLRVGSPRANPDAQPAPVADADVDAAPDLPKPAANAAGSTKPEAKKDAQTQYDFYTLLPGKEVQMSDAELAASARAEAIRQAKAQAAAGTAAAGTTPAAAATAPTATAANPTPLPETPSTAASATPAASRPAAAAATPAATTAPAAAAATAAPDTARYILQAGSFGASGDAESTKAKLAMLGLSARVESAQISGKTVYRVRMGPYGTASELAEAKQKLNGSGLSAIAIKAQ
ncbi:SPOR domain-containing protein [Xanthomonas sp. A2111]|uniref:SPOR domain-containing protein n=1 Tax=Xanthomonas hawaiiensis TaxID=3003247 RepID=A0ABU2I625_9XANT|nr:MULTISPECIES: SPOR domain-containing protein [unclassified Xanthomonas]MBO9830537.1 SPOR domain-containing protein [Xanthomonas sp. A2111]MBO9875787.1 SPOR domain-containing protein [Xanthomonas sp. D-93]MDS9993594.1 SPOR domain-containing protein [Xanthomonas sp. A2111]WNH45341.1 SPOR domain-containing protein [Xanthomonas sp. A6251]